MIKRVAKDSSLVVIDEAGVGAGVGVDIDHIINIRFWNSRCLFWSRSGEVWLVVVYT